MSTQEIRLGRSPSAVCRWALCGALVWGGLLPSSTLMGSPVLSNSDTDSVWWQQSEVVASLDLSSGQVSSLETELITHRQEIDRLSVDFDREQDRLELLMEDPGADSLKLKDQMRRAIESRGALEVAHGGFLLAIREILDPDQWQALKAYADQNPLALDPTRPLPPRPPEPPAPPSLSASAVVPRPPAPKAVPDPPRPTTPPVVPVAPVAPEVNPAPKPPRAPVPVVAMPDPSPAPAVEPVVAPSRPPAPPLPPAPPAPVVWWHDSASQDRLNLSRRQVDALDQVANRHASRLEEIQESIFRVERELQPIIDADEVESKVARNKLVELGRVRMDLRLAVRDMDLELRGLLTVDQRSLLSGRGH